MKLYNVILKLLFIFSWRNLFGRRRRFNPVDGQYMIQIKCRNPECTAPGGIFEFDESAFGAIGPGTAYITDKTKNIKPFIIECPFCHTDNLVRLEMPYGAAYGMDVIIVKDRPLDFK